MTKKHFESIAAILRENDHVEDVIRNLSYYLSVVNPRFDRNRFDRAANINRFAGRSTRSWVEAKYR